MPPVTWYVALSGLPASCHAIVQYLQAERTLYNRKVMTSGQITINAYFHNFTFGVGIDHATFSFYLRGWLQCRARYQDGGEAGDRRCHRKHISGIVESLFNNSNALTMIHQGGAVGGDP
jgi:hypothetical protein